MSDRPLICVDLDGVLNLYDGWRGADHFHPARPGAAEFLKALRAKEYEVVVHTVRWAPHVRHWIRDNGLDQYIQSVTDRKLPAHVYIDDRAICFRGDFEETLDNVHRFRAHWELGR